MSDYITPPDIVDTIRALEGRVQRLEINTSTIIVGSGPPTTAPANGAQYGDYTNKFYYLRLNGVWRKVAVA